MGRIIEGKLERLFTTGIKLLGSPMSASERETELSNGKMVRGESARVA
jgi:hypothetical protein